VILRRRQDDEVAARDDDENGSLFAVEAVLDENLAAGGTEFIAREHVVHGGFGFGHRLGDDDTFAGREAIGFDYDGGRFLFEIVEGRFDGGENPGGGARDFIFEQHLLGENLGSFQPGPGGLRTVDGNPGGDEPIGEPERERHFGTDDDEFNFLLLRERDEAGDVVSGDRETGHVLRDARIARGADDARLGRAECQCFHERVFAPAGADDEEGGREFIFNHG